MGCALPVQEGKYASGGQGPSPLHPGAFLGVRPAACARPPTPKAVSPLGRRLGEGRGEARIGEICSAAAGLGIVSPELSSPVLAGGMNGAANAHSRSVISDGYRRPARLCSCRAISVHAMIHSISSQRRLESHHTGIAQQLSDRALRGYNGIPRQHFHLFIKECEWRFNYRPIGRMQDTLIDWWFK